jgi:hypothetical protein
MLTYESKNRIELNIGARHESVWGMEVLFHTFLNVALDEYE